MTEVSFHFNVGDRIDYACRLVRKATRSGVSVVLVGPGPTLDRFDVALWTFDDLEFIAHRRLRPGQGPADDADPTRVWLVEDAVQVPYHEVLVNLGTDTPIGFESFEKVIEIVTSADDDRAAGRVRWRHYANRGYDIRRHEMAG